MNKPLPIPPNLSGNQLIQTLNNRFRSLQEGAEKAVAEVAKLVTGSGTGGTGGNGGAPPAPSQNFQIQSVTAGWDGQELNVSVQVSGFTAAGGHIYVEDPDQSLSTGLDLSGSTALDGTTTLQGNWDPEDYGQFPYDVSTQPWQFTIADPTPGTSIRVYVQAYSEYVDPAPAEYGDAEPTPSATFTVPAYVAKPGSGVEYEPLVGGITADYPLKSGSALIDDNSTGKLATPVAVYVDLSNLGTLPRGFAFEIVGIWDNDPNAIQNGLSTQVTATGPGGLVPLSVPDAVVAPHSFLLDTPTAVMGMTLYARSVRILSAPPNRGGGVGMQAEAEAVDAATVIGAPHGTAGIQRNTIVPGVTPAVHITVGTTTGVADMAAAMVGSYSSEFCVDQATGLWTMSSIDMTKAANLSSQFAIKGGLQTITNLAADLIVTGELQVGGGGRMSLIKQFDALTGLVLTGLIGDDRVGPLNPNGSGFYGAWFKGPFGVGGTPGQPAFGTDSSGNAFFHNVQISGSLIVGQVSQASYAGNSGTATSAETATTALNYAGTIQCSQLTAGTISVLSRTAGVTVASSVDGYQIAICPGIVTMGYGPGGSGGGGPARAGFSTAVGTNGSVLGLWDYSGANTVMLTTLAGAPPGVWVNALQVLTTRQTGPGNTTDATDVATRFNLLLASLRTHGLIT